MAVGPSGNIYVLDSNNCRVEKFDSSGTFIAEWGPLGTGDGEFTFPRGLVVDTSGLLAELDYLVAKLAGTEVELALLHEVARGADRLADFGPGEVSLAREVIKKYPGLDLGLADASMVVVAESLGVRDLLTLDERPVGVIVNRRTAKGRQAYTELRVVGNQQ